MVNSLDQLGSTLAPSSSADAQAVTNLAQTVSILAQQSGRFTDLLQALNGVSTQGRSLLETYMPQINDQLTALGAVANQLGAHQQDLLGLLHSLPLHNTSVPKDVVNNFVQVLDNLIVCGIPGGGADPSSAAATLWERRMSKRLIINLIVFFAVSIALIVYGYGNLIGNPLQPPTQVSAVFPNASGLYNNFSVQLNGVDVGSVTGVKLTATGARVEMAIKHGVEVPGDVQASIDAANDLGEQVVELTPQHGGTAKPLTSGAVIPVARVESPPTSGRWSDRPRRCCGPFPPGSSTPAGRPGNGAEGASGDLRQIVSASTVFSQEFLAYQNQFRQLLANAPPVLNAVTAVGPQLQDALNNTQTLVQVLATQRFAIDQLLKQGTGASTLLDNLLSSQAANLGCLVTDLAHVSSNLAEPSNLTPLSNALLDNHYFFGAVENVIQPGTAKALPIRGTSRSQPADLALPPVAASPVAVGGQLSDPPGPSRHLARSGVHQSARHRCPGGDPGREVIAVCSRRSVDAADPVRKSEPSEPLSLVTRRE